VFPPKGHLSLRLRQPKDPARGNSRAFSRAHRHRRGPSPPHLPPRDKVSSQKYLGAGVQRLQRKSRLGSLRASSRLRLKAPALRSQGPTLPRHLRLSRLPPVPSHAFLDPPRWKSRQQPLTNRLNPPRPENTPACFALNLCCPRKNLRRHQCSHRRLNRRLPQKSRRNSRWSWAESLCFW